MLHGLYKASLGAGCCGRDAIQAEFSDQMMTLSQFFSLDFGPSEASAKNIGGGLLDRCVENFHGHK